MKETKCASRTTMVLMLEGIKITLFYMYLKFVGTVGRQKHFLYFLEMPWYP